MYEICACSISRVFAGSRSFVRKIFWIYLFVQCMHTRSSYVIILEVQFLIAVPRLRLGSAYSVISPYCLMVLFPYQVLFHHGIFTGAIFLVRNNREVFILDRVV